MAVTGGSHLLLAHSKDIQNICANLRRLASCCEALACLPAILILSFHLTSFHLRTDAIASFCGLLPYPRQPLPPPSPPPHFWEGSFFYLISPLITLPLPPPSLRCLLIG